MMKPTPEQLAMLWSEIDELAATIDGERSAALMLASQLLVLATLREIAAGLAKANSRGGNLVSAEL